MICEHVRMCASLFVPNARRVHKHNATTACAPPAPQSGRRRRLRRRRCLCVARCISASGGVFLFARRRRPDSSSGNATRRRAQTCLCSCGASGGGDGLRKCSSCSSNKWLAAQAACAGASTTATRIAHACIGHTQRNALLPTHCGMPLRDDYFHKHRHFDWANINLVGSSLIDTYTHTHT